MAGAPGQHPDNINLMCRLTENCTSTVCGRQFFRAAGAIQVVGEVNCLNHFHRTELAALDQILRAQVRGVKAVAMPNDQ
jgi:hypothetical protein